MIAGLAAGLGVVAAAYGVSAYGVSAVAAQGKAAKTHTQVGTASGPAQAAVPKSQLVASGAALYSSLACVGCHGAEAQGGSGGPSLHHLGDPDTKVTRHIENGFSGRMPAYKDTLTSAQISTLVAYIQSLESR